MTPVAVRSHFPAKSLRRSSNFLLPPMQVLKCHDFRTNRMYAIKIIRNKKRFHHQALVELKVS